MPVRLLALAVGLDVAAVAQVLVHDPALGGDHGVQRDGAPVLGRLRRGAIRLALERLGAPVAIARGVDDQPLALLATAKGDAHGEVLDRVDRLAVAADQEAQVVAVELAGKPSGS